MKKLYTIIIAMICSIGVNAQYTKLLDFSSTGTGNNPTGSLISDGTDLFGTASGGGTNSGGVFFTIKKDGTGYSNLWNFFSTSTASSGYTPYGSLVYGGGFLYGMNSTGGGTGSMGTILKILPTGSNPSKLLSFTGTANGSSPDGSLWYEGSVLYGMTPSGGANNDGVIFSINANGTGYFKLLDFNGTNGSSPHGSLISDGATYLYGMTSAGGANNKGVIFRIIPNGSGYSTLLDFDGTNGSYPRGALYYDGTYLYGMANNIFKIKPDGTGYLKLLDFNGTNGSQPFGSLISDGTYLYGMTRGGGANNEGVIFKIKPDGTGYSKLLDFSNVANGRFPSGSLFYDGTYLYGMTQNGGTSGVGTIFKILPCTAALYQKVNLCPGNSLVVGVHTYTATGTYHDTLKTTGNCDSIITTKLTVLPIKTYTWSPTKCAGQSVTVGINTYTASGTYYDTLVAANTCDSIVTTNLMVSSAITNSFTITSPTCGNNNGSVMANTGGGTAPYSYSWSSGNTTAYVTGLNGSPTQTLIATITDSKNCILKDTALVQCFTGVQDYDLQNYFSIYPNPNYGAFTIATKEKEYELIIYNTLGEKILLQKHQEGKSAIDLRKAPRGVYFFQITSENKRITTGKFVIQ